MNQHVAPDAVAKPEPFYRLTLKKPIQAHGETVAEVMLRKPTTADVIRYGLPVLVNVFNNDISFVEAKMMLMMETLSALPTPALKRMDATDWMEAAWAIAGAMAPWDAAVSSIIKDRRIALAKPISGKDGNPVSELMFREATGAEMLNPGIPVVFAGDTPTFYEHKMAAMIAALASVPLESVREMDLRDFISCMWGFVVFFVRPRAEETS